MFSQIPGMYQPLMRAAEYNVRAFCPPPASTPETATINQFGWQPGPLQQPNYGYLDTSQHFSQWCMPPGHSESFLQHRSDTQLPYRPTTDLKANFSVPQPSQTILQGSYLGQNSIREGSSASNQYSARSSFTEKALSQAQEHYVELLSYLQTARKFDQITGGAGSNSRSKVLVFPRPPKSRRDNFGTLRDGHRSIGRSNPSSIIPNSHPQALTSNIEDTLSNSTRQQTGQDGLGQAHLPSTLAMHFGASPTSYPASSSFDALGPVAIAKALPVLNARNSLDILKSLCEQSHWKWIDGILLGGCLLYGLSRFEDAVDWFSRVLALDSRFDLFQMNYQVVVLYLTQIIAMLRLSQI
jgi:hypothetical protein